MTHIKLDQSELRENLGTILRNLKTDEFEQRTFNSKRFLIKNY